MRRTALIAAFVVLIAAPAGAETERKTVILKDRQMLEAAPSRTAAEAKLTAMDAKLTRLEKDIASLDAQIDAIKNDIDSMSEMGEMESLRLQMAMDRMSKMSSTLSNVLKKISDTQNTITQNLK